MNKSGLSNMSNSATLNPEERYKLLYKKKEIADQNLNALKLKIESEVKIICYLFFINFSLPSRIMLNAPSFRISVKLAQKVENQ